MGLGYLDGLVVEAATCAVGAYDALARPSYSHLGDGTPILSYCGSASVADWCEDLKCEHALWAGVSVHAGFAEIAKATLGNLMVFPETLGWRDVILTGHSLGGAIAMLHAFKLRINFPSLRVHVITFGSPRVGGESWKLVYNHFIPDSLRVVLDHDVVPQVPPIGMDYRHVGRELHIDAKGRAMSALRGGWQTLRWWLGWRWSTDSGDHNHHSYLASVKAWRARQNQ